MKNTIILSIIFLASCSAGDITDPVKPSTNVVVEGTDYNYAYQTGGTATNMVVKYTNENRVLVILSNQTPYWSYSFHAPSGLRLYIYCENRGTNGSVECKIVEAYSGNLLASGVGNGAYCTSAAQYQH